MDSLRYTKFIQKEGEEQFPFQTETSVDKNKQIFREELMDISTFGIVKE